MNGPNLRHPWHSRKALALFVALFAIANARAQDPLPSWNEGPAKQAVLAFVKDTTEKLSPKYVEPADRIATFDQDGTLWTEHPLYGQAMFALDRVGKMASQHPEWKQKEPFKSVVAGDHAAMGKFTEGDWKQIIAATHAGMSTEAFQGLVKDWLATAKAPRFDRPFTDLIYQPMLEVMQYLRTNGFRTYIVTGGGQEFVRVYSERVYGVPPVIRLNDGVIRYCSTESGSLPAPNNKTVGTVWFRRQDYERSLEPVKRGVSICS
jgi:haloacid dehalogenase-like hydrolase